MFSKELENLIQATLEDGVLEEYEKAALIKRAQNEGVDLTELEIYIQSILQRRKKELAKEEDAKQAEIDKKKKEALGPVCPKCHKQVPPLTLVCDCGYEFTTKRNLTSISVLSEKIEKINNAPFKKIIMDDDNPEYRNEIKRRNEQIVSLIRMHPVPNAKEDIIEFLAVSIPSATVKIPFFSRKKGKTILYTIITILTLPVFYLFINNWSKIDIKPGVVKEMMANAWREKCMQVLLKGRSLRGDLEFTQQLDYYENMLNK